jgi:UDP-2,3-diacylglucosamine pyrophosphatase LpxH
LERLKLNIKAFFRELFYSVSAKRDKDYYIKLVGDIEKSLIKKYRPNYNYLVCGHTHLPKINKDAGVQYVNCGDWVHNRTYVIYDSGEFTLMGGLT